MTAGLTRLDCVEAVGAVQSNARPVAVACQDGTVTGL